MKRLFGVALLALPLLAGPARANWCPPFKVEAGANVYFRVVSTQNGLQGQAGPWYLYWPLEAHFQVPAPCSYPYWPLPQVLPTQAHEYKAGAHGAAAAPASARATAIVFLVAAVLFWLIGAYAPASFLEHFTVFVLACFVGYMVIWNVTPSLHTPLMSVTNAISSIITIGALVQVAPPAAQSAAGGRPTAWIIGLAVISIALVAINMFGGFAVTQRMLQMFRK